MQRKPSSEQNRHSSRRAPKRTAADAAGAEPRTIEAEAGRGRPRVYDRRKVLFVRVGVDSWKEIRSLAIQEERSTNELLVEALNDYLRKRGKAPIA